MSLKKTIGKDKRAYYFENGKRVSNNYYKLHWYEGGKGRMSNKDFNNFYQNLPSGIDFETARTLQNMYFQEIKGELELQKLFEREKSGDSISEYVPFFALSDYSDQSETYFIKDEGTPGFQRVSKDELTEILAEKAREGNINQKKTRGITNYKIYSDDEEMYFDFTDFFTTYSD